MSIPSLTQQLMKLSVGTTKLWTRSAIASRQSFPLSRVTSASHLLSVPQYQHRQDRHASRGKNAKKKPTTANKEAPKKKEEAQPFLQHQEWVKFQQSISVDGFETGQVTTAKVLKKSKGGRRIRLKKERELEEWQAKQADLGLGKFPAIRYSPEETERLLAEAMATLPKREGKRGTRNLKRQKRRWFLVRKIRAKQKRYRIMEHERKMERRHQKRQAVLTLQEETPQIRQRDSEYQEQVLRHWAQAMVQDQSITEKESKTIQDEE